MSNILCWISEYEGENKVGRTCFDRMPIYSTMKKLNKSLANPYYTRDNGTCNAYHMFWLVVTRVIRLSDIITKF